MCRYTFLTQNTIEVKGCLHTQSLINSRFGKINKQAKSVFLCPTLTIVSSTNGKTEETHLII